MAGERHHRALERIYHAANSAQHMPATLQIADGAAELELPLRDEYLQAGKAIHGMLYFKALDEPMFYAAQSRVEDVFLVTASLTVNFLRGMGGGTMYTQARVIKSGRTVHLVEGYVRDADDRLVAHGTGTFMPGPARLADLPEYQLTDP